VADRHRDRLIELLGPDFQGIVTSDRWWAYDHLDPEQRQACWSHLQRDFRFHSEGLALQKEFGQAGLALTDRMFNAWHAFGEHQDRERLTLEMKPIQDEFFALLQHAGKKSKRHRLHRRFANNLLKIWPALWTFLTIPALTPTNNAAERALRGPVIHRKLSHGNQSNAGERFTERSLSASVTYRLQHRSLLAYLRDLHTAHQTAGALPAFLLVDRGSAFVSSQLLRACAVLGVKLIHASPRAATTKGKIERFFRTVRDQFLVEIDDGVDLRELFSDNAIGLSHEVSRGLPRQVNNLALASLIAAFTSKKAIVDESAARAAVAEISTE
jgi:transposase InsO family protein